MKKTSVIITLVLALFLSGCTIRRNVNLQRLLNQHIVRAQQAAVFEPDHYKKMYSYYISPEIGRMEGDSTGNVFNYQGTEFLMNLNISSVINNKYYKGSQNDSDILNSSTCKASDSGSYHDPDGDVHPFSISVYDIGRENYMTLMITDTAYFCGISDALMSVQLAEEMLKIARTVKVNPDAVTAAYSRKETVTFKGEKIRLFDSIAPESGRVEELFEDNSTDENSGEKDQRPVPSPSQSPAGE